MRIISNCLSASLIIFDKFDLCSTHFGIKSENTSKLTYVVYIPGTEGILKIPAIFLDLFAFLYP